MKTGCLTKNEEDILIINGFTVKGKTDNVFGWREQACLKFTDSNGITYTMNEQKFKQDKKPECFSSLERNYQFAKEITFKTTSE